jgi:hypothetical protein
MKTLAIRQPWISLIAEGDKTIEVRTWTTTYRGPLLLVASGKALRVPIDDQGTTYTLPAGCHICIADLVNVRPMRPADIAAACLDNDFDITGHYAWELINPRDVAPTPHKGRLRLYDTPDDEIAAIF